MSTPAKCLPVSISTIQLRSPVLLIHIQAGVALGATWDPALVEEAGLKLLAEEAKLRAASLILAPACNIQRVSRFFVIWTYL